MEEKRHIRCIFSSQIKCNHAIVVAASFLISEDVRREIKLATSVVRSDISSKCADKKIVHNHGGKEEK